MIKKLSGFTLIELLVVIGILGVVSVIGGELFTSITRAYNKASIIAEIEQNGNLVLEVIKNEIRSAKSVSPTSGTSTSITLITQQDTTVTFSFVAPSGGNNGYIAKNGQPITDNRDATGVNVTDATFTIYNAAPPFVIVSVTLTQPTGAPGRVDYQATTTLKTTVSMRTY